MAGFWDGVPASPCSGASDDIPASQGRASVAYTSAVGKRTRFSSRISHPPRPYSPDVAVGFQYADMSKSNRDADLVSKLNFNAADERRKMLLNKLREIDLRKAELQRAASSSGPHGATRAGDNFSPLIEAATPEPIDVDCSDTTSSGRPPHRSVSMETRDGNDMAMKASLPSLALDAALRRRISGTQMDIEQFTSCASPAPTATTTCGSPLPSPSPPPSRSPVVTHADLPSRTRASRRVTRPRTPSVLLKGMPGETVLSKLPVGVLKCKRYQFCKKLISILLKNSSAGPFSAPVSQLWSAEAIPRYFDVITKPMDLGTVKKNMEGTLYLNADESNPLLMFKAEDFAADVRQVFRNAMVYNKVGDMLYNCAEDLLEEFEAMWKNLPPLPARDENRRKRLAAQRANGAWKRGRFVESSPTRFGKSNSGLPTGKKRPASSTLPGKKPAKPVAKHPVTPVVKAKPISAAVPAKPLTIRQVKKKLEYYKQCRVALKSRTPLPKGATFYDRASLIQDVEMTFAEKSRLSEGIRRLPSTKIETFLSIVRDATEADESRGDEIELDINVLDTKTLRTIEAFLDWALPNYKTIRTSDIGTEFSRVEDFEAEEKKLVARLEEVSKRPQSSAVIDSSPMASCDREHEELYASSGSEDSGSDSGDSSSDESSDSDSE